MGMYLRNNIVFRISSAEAIANFKRAQAASFLQLTRKELVFDEAAKESILLEFDRFSQWVFKIEKLCLTSNSHTLPPTLMASVKEYFVDELNTIEAVMDSYPDVFSANVRVFAKMIHTYSSGIVLEILDTIQSDRMDYGFLQIIKCISNYLQHLLLSFHEFNNNIITHNTKPFVCAPNFCTSKNSTKFIPETHRIKFYTENKVGSVYVLKDYSDKFLFTPAVEHFNTLGVTIIPEDEEHTEFVCLDK
jgi:hypothetical protein